MPIAARSLEARHAALNGLIGEGVGKLYVAKYFPPENKAQMDELVANLVAALGQRLKTLAWMDEPTRAEAHKKLATFEPRVGYPGQWRDYSAPSVEPGKVFENARNAPEVRVEPRRSARLEGTVDRAEWGMNPQTVNAASDPLVNQITFPAGILQPPFFDPHADPAVNYGAIGAVIGHEIGHGFDDPGREFDETGRIRNWWTPATNERFIGAIGDRRRAVQRVLPARGACVNGELHDVRTTAISAASRWLTPPIGFPSRLSEAPVIDGFTGDRRFFLAHGQVWRTIQREDALRDQMFTDPHSPPPARGAVPERNIDAWYDAFAVKAGDAEYIAPENRVRIW